MDATSFADFVDIQAVYFAKSEKCPFVVYHTPLYDDDNDDNVSLNSVYTTHSNHDEPEHESDTDSTYTLSSNDTLSQHSDNDSDTSTSSRVTLTRREQLSSLLDSDHEDHDGYTVMPREEALSDEMLAVWRQRHSAEEPVFKEVDNDTPFGRLQYVLGVESITHYDWLLDVARMPAARALASHVLIDSIGAARSSPTCVRTASLHVWVGSKEEAMWCIERLMHDNNIGVMATFPDNLPMYNFAMHRSMMQRRACNDVVLEMPVCRVGCQVDTNTNTATGTVFGPTVGTAYEATNAIAHVFPKAKGVKLTHLVFQWCGPWLVCNNAHIKLIEFCMATCLGVKVIEPKNVQNQLATIMDAVGNAACKLLFGQHKCALLKTAGLLK